MQKGNSDCLNLLDSLKMVRMMESEGLTSKQAEIIKTVVVDSVTNNVVHVQKEHNEQEIEMLRAEFQMQVTSMQQEVEKLKAELGKLGAELKLEIGVAVSNHQSEIHGIQTTIERRYTELLKYLIGCLGTVVAVSITVFRLYQSK